MRHSFFSSAEMESYCIGRVNADVPPMSYLYSSCSLDALHEMIAKLSFVCVLQDLETVAPEDDATVELAGDFERVEAVLARYASFVCIANPCFGRDDFDALYEESLWYYHEHWGNFCEEFANQFEHWKDGWAGCLFIR